MINHLLIKTEEVWDNFLPFSGVDWCYGPKAFIIWDPIWEKDDDMMNTEVYDHVITLLGPSKTSGSACVRQKLWSVSLVSFEVTPPLPFFSPLSRLLFLISSSSKTISGTALHLRLLLLKFMVDHNLSCLCQRGELKRMWWGLFTIPLSL